MRSHQRRELGYEQLQAVESYRHKLPEVPEVIHLPWEMLFDSCPQCYVVPKDWATSEAVPFFSL